MQSKINWYFNRFAAMSIPEMFYRLRQAFRVFQERKYGLLKGEVNDPHWTSSQAWLAFKGGTSVHFYWDQNRRSELASEILRIYPEGRQATLHTAGFLLEHNIEIFGRSFEFGSLINWQMDPQTRYNWPHTFWAGIATSDASRGGVKWVWELNRHHHILILAKAYFLTNDERYANEALAQISSWIDQNPPLMGINWTSSLELSIRLINWIWVLELTKDSKALTEELFDKVERSISQQATYIFRHLSAYSSGNNHRVGEAAGLAFVGMMVPWLAGAQRWKQTGLEILTQEITNLILPDGGSAEQAPHYLLFILDFYFLIMRLAELNRVSIDPVWPERLRAAARFLQVLMDQQGHIPSIGDNDDAWVVRLDDGLDVNNYHSVLASSAALFRDPDLKSTAIGWDEKSMWLLGEEGKKAYDNLDTVEQKPISCKFEASGYVSMKSACSQVVMDFGPLGYGSMAAHGHADALSIWASIGGEECLVDSGTFAYQEGGIWRSYFRGTSAHNTIRIDGLDQSEMFGPFLWGKKANTRLLHWETQGDYDLIAAEHDGYKKLGITHRRLILFLKPDILVVSDHVLGSGNHKIEQFWHLAPEYKVELNGKRAELAIRQHKKVFEVWSSPLDNLSVVEGQLDPIQGWVSTHYGQKTPAPVLVHFGLSTLPVRVISIIFPGYLSPSLVEQTKNKALMILEKVKSL